MRDYVHGYSERERVRLQDQAETLTELLHHDTLYPQDSQVLEAGCGVGAQTVILAKKSPSAHFTSIDISQDSIDSARRLIAKEKIANVAFQVADIFNLPFDKESFDHVFVCFTLEHIQNPEKALACLRMFLKKGGSLTVIEGDHGSTYFHPHSIEAMQSVQCLVDIQTGMGGNSLIGRQLYPLMKSAAFTDVTVSPRMVYVDSSKPGLVEGFTKNTFIAMVEAVKKQALESNMIDEETWKKGIRELYRTTETDGTFCYAFFKGTGIKA
jgi:ubiquinone/menaquinone biosynthesis C-methylase UbiE